MQSITAPAVFKKGLPRIIDILSSSGISRITKSVKIVTFVLTPDFGTVQNAMEMASNDKIF